MTQDHLRGVKIKVRKRWNCTAISSFRNSELRVPAKQTAIEFCVCLTRP